MIPDRRPILFIGSLSNVAITPTNPNGLNAHWLAAEPGWLLMQMHHIGCDRVMISDPAGGNAPAGVVRWPHWYTLTDAQQDRMTIECAIWRTLHYVNSELAVYPARKISPPTVLDWSAHVIAQPTVQHQAWINDSLQPYFARGFTSIGLDAAETLTAVQWLNLCTMIRVAANAPVQLYCEAIKKLGNGAPDQTFARRHPQLCILNYLMQGDRMTNPAWVFDPSNTEVHCLLTAVEAAVPGRVQQLEAKGIIASCRNTWWITPEVT